MQARRKLQFVGGARLSCRGACGGCRNQSVFARHIGPVDEPHYLALIVNNLTSDDKIVNGAHKAVITRLLLLVLVRRHHCRCSIAPVDFHLGGVDRLSQLLLPVVGVEMVLLLLLLDMRKALLVVGRVLLETLNILLLLMHRRRSATIAAVTCSRLAMLVPVDRLSLRNQ